MRLFLRLVSWLVYWMAPGEEELRLEKYTMPRRGFTYKNGRADEAVPTWMVKKEAANGIIKRPNASPDVES